jgi:hypothetical protein
MNSREPMKPIVMKVGLDAGLITPELFTMLLVMPGHHRDERTDR